MMICYDKDVSDCRPEAVPRSVVLFDRLEDAVHDNRGFHVTLWCCGREVSWVRLRDRHCRDALYALLRQAKAKKERSSVGSLRELQLSQKETELASREARLQERERAVQVEETRCPSFESSSSEEEPFGSTVVLDWPLSRSEKHLRLVNALDRQRIAEVACERAKRVHAQRSAVHRRFSAPH